VIPLSPKGADTGRRDVTPKKRQVVGRGRKPLPSLPTAQPAWLPRPPSRQEKYSYVKRRPLLVTAVSLVSFGCLLYSQAKFIALNWVLVAVFSGFLFFTVLYYLIAMIVNLGAKSFDVEEHRRFVRRHWELNKELSYSRASTVDVCLPIRGESIEVLQNTWQRVRDMVRYYKAVAGPGTQVRVFVLDDGDNPEARRLADRSDFRAAGFRYHSRPKQPLDETVYGQFHDWMFRGVNKKAGNLKYGFHVSARGALDDRVPGEFIVIFDADFAPRRDYLLETIPYMVADPHLGIIQTPQFFQIIKGAQNWLERGAGAVQELFYRFIQQSRDQLDGAICVGTCAIYRRLALAENGGGPTQIGHSEDVHTGFDLRRLGWGLKYIPIALATGACPSQTRAFLQQQYRWCMGSMSLLTSRKFWTTAPLTQEEKRKAAQGHAIKKMGFRTRCCYLSGFCYYIHTAIFTFVGPCIPLTLLIAFPDQVRLVNYLLIVPSLVYNFVVFRTWHRSSYGMEALAVKVIYGWAHAFAIVDKMRGHELGWNSTGSNTKTGDWRIEKARWLIGTWGLVSGLPWVGLSVYYMVTRNVADFVPNLFSGLVYVVVIIMAISPTPEPKGQRRPQISLHRRSTV